MKLLDYNIDTLPQSCIIKNDDCDEQMIITFIEDVKSITFSNNPNIFLKKEKILTAELARSVIEFAQHRPFGQSGIQIIFINSPLITVTAQNILLKLLEEPPSYCYIFLITDQPKNLLQTVLSRCTIVDCEYKETNNSTNSIDLNKTEEFINSDYQHRLKIVNTLLKKDKDKKVDKAKLLELLSGIETYLNNNKNIVQWKQKTQAVLQAKMYMHSKGAMSKMLMESVALVL